MKLELLIGLTFTSFAAFSQITTNQTVLIKGGVPPIPVTTHSDTLFYTGTEQTWTVPCGASDISFDTYGAQGDTGTTINIGVNVGGAAGRGARVYGTHTLAPYDMLYIYVGGMANANIGGYNGGGNGVNLPAGTPSGGGGGATDVRFPSNSLTDRLQVSGGGGGGGNAGLHGNGDPITGGNGGNGGGNYLFGNSLNGTNGEDCSDGQISPGAFAGTTAGPGAGALGCGGYLGAAGTGSLGGAVGGNGGAGNAGFGFAQSTMAPSGGGGGGGYVGGNGGGGGSAGTTGCSGNAFGAGGGGSAGTNFNIGTTILEWNGFTTGDGMVVINYNIIIDSASINETFTAPCVGENITLDATPAGGVFEVVTGPNDIAGAVFTPTQETTYEVTYTVIDACFVETIDTISIVVNCDVAGLNENTTEELVIYPNPTTSYFTVKVAHFDNLTIEDMNGKTVKTINQYEAGQISVKSLKAGVYFVKITSNGQVQTQKLIIE